MKKLLHLVTALLAFLAAPATMAAADIITQVPEDATITNYWRSTRAWFEMNESYLAQSHSGYIRAIAECPDGTVYLQNVLTARDLGGVWIKGTKEGNTITVPIPQPVAVDEKNGGYLQISKVRYSNGNMVRDTSADNIRFDIEEDGTIKMEAFEAASIADIRLLALLDSRNNWTFYGEQNLAYHPITDEVVTPPAEAQFDTWALVTSSFAQDIKVSFVDDKVYLQGFLANLPEAAIEGSVAADGAVTFNSGQYLGVIGQSMFFFTGVLLETVPDDTGALKTDYNFANTLEAVANEERTEIVFEKTAAMGFYVNPESPVIEYMWSDLTLAQGSVADLPYTTLMPPSLKIFMPYGGAENEGLDYGAIVFDFPRYNKNFLELRTDDLFYQVYYNYAEEPFMMSTETYADLPKGEDTDLIPFGYKDAATDFNYKEGLHYFYFRERDVEVVGVRTVFFAPDGYKYFSDIVFSDNATVIPAADPEQYMVIEPPHDGIDSVDGTTLTFTVVNGVVTCSDPSAALSVYDMQGRTVTAATLPTGMYIVKAVKGDSAVVAKIVI